MRSFSLDTPPVVPRQVMTGHNFREVAPEVLSPLTWSVVGAGMERGFRQIAATLRVDQRSPGPQYVGYVAFRPFHVASTLELIVARMPWFEAPDVWYFVFGGLPPAGAVQVGRVRTRTKVRTLPDELRLVHRNGVELRSVETAVAAAEAETVTALRHGTSWRYGVAWQAAVAAARDAWALHVRTSGIAIASAAILRRLLQRSLDDASVDLLLRTVMRRAQEADRSGYALGRLRRDATRAAEYEVADAAEPFAPWRRPELAAAAAGPPRPDDGGELRGQLALPGVPGALARSWAVPVELMLAERERSKAAGLRALHCVRCLADVEATGLPVDRAAFLGVDELVGLPSKEALALAAERAAELKEAMAIDLAVDLQHSRSGWQPIERDVIALSASTSGAAMAPGRAEGDLEPAPHGGDGPDVVLYGERVEAADVLRTLPVAVVTRYGSVLSHVAIVCRELGIPLVAGVRIAAEQRGTRVQVDGWSGEIVAVGS